MPVRLRIALNFTVLVCLIFIVMSAAVYYIAHRSRINAVEARLTIRVNNIASLFKRSGVTSGQWIQKIDSMTAAPSRDKEIQVFDNTGARIYEYKDREQAAWVPVDSSMITSIRDEGYKYFIAQNKDVVAIHDPVNDLVIISATNDEIGKLHLFHLRIALGISLMVGVFIAFWGGYLFAGKLLRPVRDIADRVNHISARKLDQRIETGTTNDEWKYLADTLNQLLDRLSESLHMHRKFISNASHELSSPLNAIAQQLDIVMQKDRTGEEYKMVLSKVYRDALHLSKLTRVLLEFAKTAGEEGDFHVETVRIDEVLLELPSEMVRINTEYRVLLEFDDLPDQEEDMLIMGNAKLLLSAFQNIALNACKYSPDRTAFVRLSFQDADISVEIVDNGPGIPERELQHIFQPYFRGEHVESAPGFGLGLSLAQRIIKLHKGRITVSSNERTGSRFVIAIPSGFKDT